MNPYCVTIPFDVSKNHVKCKYFFIDTTNIDRANKYGWTPLHYAIIYENVKMINILINAS